MNWILILKIVLTISILSLCVPILVYCIYMGIRGEIEDLKREKEGQRLKKETEDLAMKIRITKEQVSKRVEFLRMQMQLISEGRGAECVSLNDEEEK